MATPQVIKSMDGKPHCGGLTGFISWDRLAKEGLLLTDNEKKQGKKIVQFEADHNGIKFIIE